MGFLKASPFDALVKRQMWEDVAPEFKVCYVFSIWSNLDRIQRIGTFVEEIGVEHDLKLLGVPGDYILACYFVNDQDWKLTSKLIHTTESSWAPVFKAENRHKR